MLHWMMAVLVLAMLYIGIGMVSSLSDYHWLVSTHWPLGVRTDCAAARDRRCGGAASERRGPHDRHRGRHQCYNARKKFNRACWSAGDSISKLKITVLASEPALA
jgi:hypothetical protein